MSSQTDEEREFIDMALAAADAGNAGHWPTVAGHLADEVRRLRALNPAATSDLRQALETFANRLAFLGSNQPRSGTHAQEEADNARDAAYQRAARELRAVLAGHPAEPAADDGCAICGWPSLYQGGCTSCGAAAAPVRGIAEGGGITDAVVEADAQVIAAAIRADERRRMAHAVSATCDAIAAGVGLGPHELSDEAYVLRRLEFLMEAVVDPGSAPKGMPVVVLPLLASQPVLDRAAVAKVFRDAMACGLDRPQDEIESYTDAVMELARPMPTREQIAEALHKAMDHPNIEACPITTTGFYECGYIDQSNRLADAVMELAQPMPTLKQVKAVLVAVPPMRQIDEWTNDWRTRQAAAVLALFTTPAEPACPCLQHEAGIEVSPGCPVHDSPARSPARGPDR